MNGEERMTFPPHSDGEVPASYADGGVRRPAPGALPPRRALLVECHQPFLLVVGLDDVADRLDRGLDHAAVALRRPILLLRREALWHHFESRVWMNVDRDDKPNEGA